MVRKYINSLKFRRLIYRGILVAGDAVCVLVALRAAVWTRFHAEWFVSAFPVTKGFPTEGLYPPLQAAALGIWVVTFLIVGFYRRINQRALDDLLRVAHGVLTGWIVLAAVTFLARGFEYSRLVLGLCGLYAFAFIYVFRELMKALYALVAERLWEPHTALILGAGRMSKSIQRVLSAHPEVSMIHRSTKDPKELEKFLHDHQVREVFVAEPDLDHATLVEMSDVCDQFDVPFRIVPDVLELRMGEVIIDNSLGLPTFQVKPVTLHGWTYFYKRVFDILFSISLLAFGMLPLLFIAFVIRMDSDGPILLQQPRMGFRRRQFQFFKFRTMIENADDFLEELKKRTDRPGPVFKMKDDPRITRVGKWLRKFSLDEVPQILNVLRGEMSLVGPRPQVLWEAAAYDSWARKRLNVLPGITGLWQVSGRAQLSYEEMIDLDVYYIEHWSPGLDLKILLRTVPTILSGQGAY